MRYCTRANVHVDRCASAWLIRRFVDPDAEFVFVAVGEPPATGTISFDMVGDEWGHRSGGASDETDQCTFETIAELHGLTEHDPALAQLARIIHGADIIADADETLESAGVDLLFRGLRLVAANDADALERGYMVMDALYAALRVEIQPASAFSP